MADELKENVTTPWMQNELTAEEISRNDPDGENTGFWILRGKGSGRDRFISLKNLRTWIDAAAAAVAYIKENGIDGIKKALTFSAEGVHRAVSIDATGITFAQDSWLHEIAFDDGVLQFGGPTSFTGYIDGEVDVHGSVKVKDEILVADSDTAIVHSKVTSGGVETTGSVKGSLGSFTNGLDVFEGTYTFSQNEAYIRTQLALGSGLNVYGDAEIGGYLRSSSVKKNELENLHVASADGSRVNIHNGIVHTSDYMHGKHMMVDVYTSKDRLPYLGSAPAGALACYQNGTSWKLCFWNGLNWIDIA